MNEKSDDEKRRIYEARIAGFQKVSSPACISKKETSILNLIEHVFNIKIERQFCIKHNNKIYLFDGKYKNIIIEFNGDFWHCNPALYNESFFHPIKQQYARDIWQFDDFKNNEVAKDYKIFIIWENELHDTDGIINRFELYLQNCADK